MNRILPLAGLLVAVFSAGAQEVDARHVRGALDGNHDGVVDRHEAAHRPGLARHFDVLDANRDGRRDASERTRHGRHGRHAGLGLQRMDLDRDGRVSRAEFERAQSTRGDRHGTRPGTSSVRSLREPLEFGAIDTDRDGYIVAAELRAHHARIRPRLEAARRARVERRFVQADVNRDGRLGRGEVSATLPRLLARFDGLDANRDSFLSREELQRPRRSR